MNLNNIKPYLIFSILILFFICSVIYFLKIDQSLIYHYTQPFFTGQLEWKNIILNPGYLSSYISLFIFQFFFLNFLGSVILVTLIIIWCLCLIFIFKKYFNNLIFIFPVLLSVLPLISAHSNYNYPFQITISYLIALGIGLIYNTILRNKTIYNLINYIILAVLTYIISGSPGLFIFISVITGIFIIRKKYIFILIHLIIGLLIPIVFSFVSNTLPLQFALVSNFHDTWYGRTPLIIYLMPVIICIALIIPVIYSSVLKKKKYWIIELIIHTLIIIVLFYFTIHFSFKEKEKKFVEINKLAYEQKWDEILNRIDENLIPDKYVQFHVNRALYHKGLLLEKMFDYSQLFGADALQIERKVTGAIAIHTSDLYYDLGLLNEARHWANESYTIYGNGPRVLQRLSDVFIASQQYEVAERYINLLDKSIVTRKIANEFKKYLYCDSCVVSNINYKRFYESNPKDNFFASHKNPLYNLKQLYLNNPNNKMAFEYIIAYFLLTHKIKEAVSLYGEFEKLGYNSMPRACEEAFLLFLAQNNIPISQFGNTVDKKTIHDYKEVGKIIAKYNGDLKVAKEALQPFQKTYWYYLFYNSPITNQR